MSKTLPAHITAATGMDALTHAIEAYTSVNRFSDAERDAKLAIKLLLKYLPEACSNGSNLEAREMVALASFLAGYAFNKSGLGYVHAISHQISALYNTPHGLANAVILPKVLRFSQSACADRLADLERMISGTSANVDEQLAERFIGRVDALCNQVGIPDGLAELQADDFAAIAKNARKEAKWFYAVPRTMSQTQCKEILASIPVATSDDAGNSHADSGSATTTTHRDPIAV